jgi:UTP--glucose-1-phosphate uridylyltransferase
MPREVEGNQNGDLLRQMRETAGLSRTDLASRVGLDASYIYRLEIGTRRPTRESTLALAEALGAKGEDVNRLLMAAGYAPVPLLELVRGRRGAAGTASRSRTAASLPDWDVSRWAQSLESMGLQAATIGALLRAMESSPPEIRQDAARSLRAAFGNVIERLQNPVATAVIPAAGGQHRLLASQLMQRLLFGVIAEAAESGVSNFVLVLAPGTIESLYQPLKDALNISLVPRINLHCREQTKARGVGDAILEAEQSVGITPFAVLLPDDVVRERIGRAAHARQFQRMIDAFKHLRRGHLIAVTRVAKSKMSSCGIARTGRPKREQGNLLPVVDLVERPDPGHSIRRSSRARGIVGRYVLRPSIFSALHTIKDKGQQPVHLTDALELLRESGEEVWGFSLESDRHDVGEAIGQAADLMGWD